MVTGRPRPPRIVLFGLFGSSNLGNDATLGVTLDHLRKRQPEAEIACVCRNQREVERVFQIKTLPMDPLPPWGFWRIPNRTMRHACTATFALITEPVRAMRIARHLAGVQQFLVVGTGVLDDFGEQPWAMPAWLLRWCSGAKRAGAVVRFLAVGAGPIRNPVNRYLMVRAVLQSDYRSYRDSVSRAFAQSVGVNVARDPVVPDLVFAISEEELVGRRQPSAPPKSIGVGVMGYYGWSNDRGEGITIYEKYIEKMSAFVLWLLRQGYLVHVLLGQLNADERPVQDLIEAVSAKLDVETRRRLLAPKIESLDDLMGAIAETDAVVATRYHNVICALSLGRPVIAVGYASKFDDLMQEVGLASYCQSIEHLDVELLMEQFARLSANHGALVAQVKAKVATFRGKLNAMYDSLFGHVPAE